MSKSVFYDAIEYVAKPIQIYKLENNKYRVDVNAINSILDKIGDRNAAIYSINGSLRMGKSFMLNFFLRYLMSNDKIDWINEELNVKWNEEIDEQIKLKTKMRTKLFGYRGGSKRDTTGIWMWSEPFFIKKNNKEIAILLMDTQGSFDNQTTMQDNACIFALSTLLSSFIIFNVEKQISEDKLQVLQYFAGFARLTDKENCDEPFQRLLFLVRDFQFKEDFDYGYYDDKHSINGKNYKKETLDPQNNSPIEVKFVHEMVLSSFDNVACYLLPYPGREIASESRYDPKSQNPDFLEFREHLKELIIKVFSCESIVEKKIGGELITGNQLKRFVNKWGQMFEYEVLPEAKTFLSVSNKTLKEMAKESAIDNYNQIMRGVIKSEYGTEATAFKILHNQAVNESIELFNSFKGFDRKNNAETIAKIKKALNLQYEYYKSLNDANFRCKNIENEFKEECERLKRINRENAKKLSLMYKGKANEREYKEKIEKTNNLIKGIEDEYGNEFEKIRVHKQSMKLVSDEFKTIRSNAESAQGSSYGSSHGNSPVGKGPPPVWKKLQAHPIYDTVPLEDTKVEIDENINEQINKIRDKYYEKLYLSKTEIYDAENRVLDEKVAHKNQKMKRCSIL